jgi:UDP-glucose 4-epimerase
MKKVLVTGGAGAIGSRLVSKLCVDHQVLVLDDLSSGFLENLRDLPVTFWRGSVVDDEILKEVFSEKPEVVFHLAANFANQNSVDYPQKDLLVNGMGTLKILQYARDAAVKRFIYASSSCVYGNIQEPIREDSHKFSLDTPYAVTKLLGEQYINFFHEHHALPTVVLRFFNSYGPGEYPGKYRNVIPNFMFKALHNTTLSITGSGEETRDFTFIDDTVQAILLVAKHPEAVGKTFNVASGLETSINRLAEAIIKVCGSDSKIEYQKRRDWDTVSRRCADIGALRALGYAPTTGLEEGLARTFEWFRDKGVSQYRPL